MARKRYADEDCLAILRQVELDLATGADVAKACQTAGTSDAKCLTKNGLQQHGKPKQ
jgi:putative transposase